MEFRGSELGVVRAGKVRDPYQRPLCGPPKPLTKMLVHKIPLRPVRGKQQKA